MDATQLKITHGSEKIYCILPPNRNTSIPVTSEENSNQLDVFYKCTALVNASGHISDPYLLFSDNNYSANDEKHFEHYEIPGVGKNTEPLHVGILKKRGGNKASWTWLLSEYIIDQMNNYRKKMDIPCDQKFVLTLDGEDAQLNPFIDEFDDAIKKNLKKIILLY